MTTHPLFILIALFSFGLASPARAACDLSGLPDGTEVAEIETALGSICMELLRSDASKHVDNFLHYLQNGDLASSFFHRADPGFVVQGGEFRVNGEAIESITASGPSDGGVPNEPCTLDTPSGIGCTMICSQRGNERGTVALAKPGGQLSSGTTSWFINLKDNRSSLDCLVNNGNRFTVFAQLFDGSIAVVDAIDALTRAGIDRVYWVDPSFASPITADLPLLADVPLSAPGFGCFEPTNLAAVVDSFTLAAVPDPVLNDFFFVSGDCGTPTLVANFVANPSQTACPDDDRLALGITGPATLLIREDGNGDDIAFSLTCDEITDNLMQRPLWRSDFRLRLNAQVVAIQSTQLTVVPEPKVWVLALSAWTTLIALARCKRGRRVC